MHPLNRLLLFCAILFLLPAHLAGQGMVINEFMSDNETSVTDDDGDHSDWIELYNTGSSPVNLEGYGLSDLPGEPFRWVLPGVEVPPGGYLLVWASGKDRTDPQQPLHASFSISKRGEPLLLTHPQGTPLDSVAPLEVPADLSFGRSPEGAQAWLFFADPTPGQANASKGFSSILAAPELSATPGFYEAPFYLEVTSSDPDATYRYTLDGSLPQQDDPQVAGPILIDSRQGEPNQHSMIPTNDNDDPGPPYYEGWQPPLGEVFKVNVVRVAAFKEGAMTSEATTATYLVDPQGSQRYSLPVFSLSAHPGSFFDPDTGIYVPGHHNNYFQKGDQWERQVHMEFFEPGGLPAFAQQVGIRIHGGTTRSRPRKSLRVYSRSDYGTSRITHQLFPHKPIIDFNRFLLRNAGNDWDWAVFRDGFMQHLAKEMKVETQYYRPSVVFLNGEYWGIHNIRDRYDEDYFETHYGIAAQDLVALENRDYNFGNQAGRQHYLDMISYVEQNNMAAAQHYREVTTRMDPASFADFQIANIYAMNTDWPGNNNHAWRYINSGYDPYATEPLDGRWRWMLLDMDFGFGLPFFYVPGVEEGPAHNTLAMATDAHSNEWPNPAWSTLLLRRLLENTTFRNHFINRFADLLNTDFQARRVVAVLDSLQQLLEPHMQEHINRWRRPASMQEWHQTLDDMRDFARQRPIYMRRHLRQQFGLQDTALVTLSVNDPAMGQLQINTVRVPDGGPWSGTYFRGVPVRLVAHPEPGYRLASWQGVSALAQDTLQLVLSGDVQLQAVFEPNDDFPGDEMNPAAFRLSQGEYHFGYWDPNAPQGSFPDHMVFQQSTQDDPRLGDPMSGPYQVPYLEYHDDDMAHVGYPYRLSRRTRINGLGQQGISLINTGRGRDLGAVVLALDTREVAGVYVSWTAGTLEANSRVYAIRLQVQVGRQGVFSDVTDAAGNPVEYLRNEQEGHARTFSTIRLPEEANNQPYVLLRWKYYFTGTQLDPESGARDMLRLDDIRVFESGTPVGPVPEALPADRLLQNVPNPFSENTRIDFELAAPGPVVITLHDQRGLLVNTLVDQTLEAGRHAVHLQAHGLPAGVYFYRMKTASQASTKRMMILK